MKRQTFDILDPFTGKKIGSKSRLEVHRSGDWHRAANAYIVRPNPGNGFEVLTQKRSLLVDIAQNKLDQSLATQLLLEDKADTYKAVFRGLKEELDIHEEDVEKIILFNRMDSFKIIKWYDYNKDLWNRELINNYIIVLKPTAKIHICPKVSKSDWIEWEEFKNVILLNPSSATKTVRLLVADEHIASIFEKYVIDVLKGIDRDPVNFDYVYFSGLKEDIAIHPSGNEWEACRIQAIDSIKTIEIAQLKKLELDIIKLQFEEVVGKLFV